MQLFSAASTVAEDHVVELDGGHRAFLDRQVVVGQAARTCAKILPALLAGASGEPSAKSSGDATMPMRWREEVDVIVVGGGTAGSIAAIAAGRTGAEDAPRGAIRADWGMTSAGMTYLGFLDGQGRQAVAGFRRNSLIASSPLGRHSAHRRSPPRVRNPADPRCSATRSWRCWRASGATSPPRVSFGCPCRPRAIRGVLVETKGGRQVLPGRVIVDATGDADVAARAGAAFELGRTEDGKLQPVSRIFRVGMCTWIGCTSIFASPGRVHRPGRVDSTRG